MNVYTTCGPQRISLSVEIQRNGNSFGTAEDDRPAEGLG